MFYCRVDQLADRLAHNQEVEGSSPSPAPTLTPRAMTAGSPALHAADIGQAPDRALGALYFRAASATPGVNQRVISVRSLERPGAARPPVADNSATLFGRSEGSTCAAMVQKGSIAAATLTSGRSRADDGAGSYLQTKPAPQAPAARDHSLASGGVEASALFSGDDPSEDDRGAVETRHADPLTPRSIREHRLSDSTSGLKTAGVFQAESESSIGELKSRQAGVAPGPLANSFAALNAAAVKHAFPKGRW
jgi:hypothetical protein